MATQTALSVHLTGSPNHLYPGLQQRWENTLCMKHVANCTRKRKEPDWSAIDASWEIYEARQTVRNSRGQTGTFVFDLKFRMAFRKYERQQRAQRRRLHRETKRLERQEIRLYKTEYAAELVDDEYESTLTARQGSKKRMKAFKPNNATTHRSTHRAVGSADIFTRRGKKAQRRMWRDRLEKVQYEIAFAL